LWEPAREAAGGVVDLKELLGFEFDGPFAVIFGLFEVFRRQGSTS
jgi:hypothetical protein